MEQEIVVTGTRIRDDFWDQPFFRSWLDTGFDNYYVTPSGSDGGGSTAPVTIEQAVPSGKANYTVPATSTTPKFVLHQVTRGQFDSFMKALDNSKKDAGLSAQFKTLADNGIPINISVAESLPPSSSPDARGRIDFLAVGDINGNNEYIPQGTDIEITILGRAVTNSSWDTTFEGLIAHELTHLVRDGNNRFLDDHLGEQYSGPTTYTRERETYDNLFPESTKANYVNSLDVTLSYDLMYGTPIFTGTDGNNIIRASAHPDIGFLQIFTGSGNDLILGSDAFTLIIANGDGKKAIVTPGVGFQMLEISTISTVNKVVLTYIGDDLYITSSDSAYSPFDDPNAVVIIGQKLGTNEGAVESLMAADTSTMDIYNFGSYNYALQKGGGG